MGVPKVGTTRDYIQYWCEIAAMRCSEAGLLFGHGKYYDAAIQLDEARNASDMVKIYADLLDKDTGEL